MHFDAANLTLVLPEIAVLLTACLVLVADLHLKPEQKGIVHTLTLLGIVIALALAGAVGGGDARVILGGNVVHDRLADLLKEAILLVSLFAFIYARPWLEDHKVMAGEFYSLGLFAVLGMLIMVAANSFITLYLGLELQALSLYALVAYDRGSSRGAEAAMKYFVLGAIGSGMLLYGMSMIYGATGSIELQTVASAVLSQGIENKVLVFGIVFMVIGIGFKFGAVPFHMWVPDVYEGAPTPTVLLLGSAPKIAAFALAIRVFVDGLESLHADWQQMLVILSVLSMGLGNVVAVAQRNVKRMLAYSTISHVGFIFLGLLAGTPEGYAAAMFYAIVYALMATAAFGILILLGRNGIDAENLEDLKGLNDRDSLYAAMMAIVMFSMAGVPPTVGFMAKLLVLEAVVHIHMVWLAVVAVFFSIIGAFYYIRLVRYLYFDKPAEDAPALLSSGGVRIAMTVNGLVLLILGLFPAALLSLCQGVFA